MCALAPTSMSLIIGRSVAGLGAAGIFSGVTISIAHTAPLRILPLIISSMGAMVAIGFIVSPPLRGLFTTQFAWP